MADPAQCITGNCLHEKLLPLSNGNCLRIRPLWLPILRGSEWFYSNTVDCPLVGTYQQRWWSLSHCGENTHASGQLPSRTEHRQGIVTTFFVTMRSDDNINIFTALAKELTALLAMPVKLEKYGSHVSCGALRLRFSADKPVHVTVAFRTDNDRQGEDHMVTSWPPRQDPRVPLVLPSLLHGLASKLRLYHVSGTNGYTSAIRKATAFIRSRGYPIKWWARSWTLALIRQGAVAHCLPRLLRTALHQS